MRGSYDSEFGFVKDEGVGRKGIDLGEEEERFVGVEGIGGGLQQLESFGEDLVANGEPSLNDKYESSLSLPLSLSPSLPLPPPPSLVFLYLYWESGSFCNVCFVIGGLVG